MKLIAATACIAAVAAAPKGHGDHSKDDYSKADKEMGYGADSPSMSDSLSHSMSGKGDHDMMKDMMSGGAGQMGNNMFVEGTVFINNGQASYGMAMGEMGDKQMPGKGGKGGKGDMMAPMGGQDMMHMKALMHMMEEMDIEEEDVHNMLKMKVGQKFMEYQHCRHVIGNKIMMMKMNGQEDRDKEDGKGNNKGDKNNNKGDKNNNKGDKNDKQERRRRQTEEEEEEDDKKNNKGDKNNNKGDKNNGKDDEKDMENMDMDHHMDHEMDHDMDMGWLMNAWSMDEHDAKEMMHHMPEMPEMIKEMIHDWESVEEFYEKYGSDIAHMKEEMMADEEDKAMHDMYMSYYKEEVREEVEMMYPYTEHMKFKYCLALPHMMEMMEGMAEMMGPMSGSSPSMSESSSSSSSGSMSESGSDSMSMSESMPEGDREEDMDKDDKKNNNKDNKGNKEDKE